MGENRKIIENRTDSKAYGIRHAKLRIFINSLIVPLLLLSRLFLRKKCEVRKLDPKTGTGEYSETYYALLFIKVYRRTRQMRGWSIDGGE